MKVFFIIAGMSIAFLFLSGCSNKDVSISGYYPNYTKDEILLAGKHAFRDADEYEYTVNSYRDRLEVTRTVVVFDTLYHKDYILKAEEDSCGTLVTLIAAASLGIEKTDKPVFWKSELLDVVNKIDSFLNKEHPLVKPAKDMSKCIIHSEFDRGLLKESIKNVFGNNDEDR